MSKRRNDKKFMICLTPKPNKNEKEFRNNWSFFITSTQLRITLYGAFWKTKQTQLHIGSLKTAIEEEWNKMTEEFILMACKSLRRRVDMITGKKMAVILSKFTVLFLSYFIIYLKKNQN